MMRLFDILIRSRSLKEAFLKSFFFWNPVINVALSAAYGFHNFRVEFPLSLFISTVCSCTCFGACWLAKFTDRWIARRNGVPPRIRKRIGYYAISLLFMPLGMYLALVLGSIIYPPMRKSIGDTVDYYRTGIFIGTMFACTFWLLNSVREAKEAARKSRLKLKEMENERLKAQISALTAQMNPHLLFNALNTVASLVPTDPDQAESTILKLSDLYRGVLDASRKSTHSLKEELGLCTSYLAIEKARFGQRLNVYMDIDDKINAASFQVPVLCLQPLVENAVKHGISAIAAGGTVAIRAAASDEGVVLFVEDDGVGFGKSTHTKGTGTGISNCRERLNLHYGARAGLEVMESDAGTRVRIFLPAVEKSVEKTERSLC